MSNNTQTNGSATPAKIDPRLPARDIRAFSAFVKSRMPSLQSVAARHLRPERLYRLLVVNVTKTPALQKCSMESIFRAALQSAELGLEPGSATGQGYLVPYGDQCTFIPGYRGLILLAFRSGHVQSVSAQVVYQGDHFEFEMGLAPKLRHIPSFDAARDPKDITFAYCVVKLKDGGEIYDVMTRGEIDRIRSRSKAGGSGPWVTDYAEMARKTVTRRCLKYAPMSVEMSKALALEEAHDTGDTGVIEAEFESLDLSDVPEVPTKTDSVKEKIGKAPEPAVDPETGEVQQPDLVGADA